MADYYEKTSTESFGSKRGEVFVEGSTHGCPLTMDLRRIRYNPSVTYYRSHIWTREENGEFKVGLDDLTQKLLQPIKAWIGSSPGLSVKRSEHLFWVETLGGLVSFNSPVDGTVRRINEQLYNQPQLPGRSPYGAGWVLAIQVDGEPSMDDESTIPTAEVKVWLSDEAQRWERLVMNSLGIDDGPLGATADGGSIITDPWVAIGPKGMQQLFSDFFNPL